MVVVTNDGLETQARYTNQQTAGSWSHMAVCSSVIAEATVQTTADWITTDTTAFTEITNHGFARAATTNTYEASYKSVWYHQFTCDTAQTTVGGVGITNSVTRAGSKGFLYHLFSSAKVLEVDDTLSITVKLTQSA